MVWSSVRRQLQTCWSVLKKHYCFKSSLSEQMSWWLQKHIGMFSLMDLFSVDLTVITCNNWTFKVQKSCGIKSVEIQIIILHTALLFISNRLIWKLVLPFTALDVGFMFLWLFEYEHKTVSSEFKPFLPRWHSSACSFSSNASWLCFVSVCCS